MTQTIGPRTGENRTHWHSWNRKIGNHKYYFMVKTKSNGEWAISVLQLRRPLGLLKVHHWKGRNN